MKKKFQLLTFISLTILSACNRGGNKFDATGSFEADEVVVSSSTPGKILSFTIDEGSVIKKDSVVGLVDPTDINLQKEQIEASIQALGEKTSDVGPQVQMLRDQIAVKQTRLDNLLHERTRIENLLKEDAATKKQLDDINFEIESTRKDIAVTEQQINVQRSNVATQNRTILSESKPLEKRAEQLKEQLEKTNIINPVNGTVLTKYAELGEITSVGKALYKIADLSEMTLRAYFTATQLSQVKLGQNVKVFVDDGAKKYKELPGTITWVSDKAEFTPKTIQTKDERANLVYAVKIKVKNDGYLKIGMYGEVNFQ